MGILNQLTGNIKPEELGISTTKKGVSVVFDLPEILVAGMPLIGTAFSVPTGVVTEWSSNLVGPLAGWIIRNPGKNVINTVLRLSGGAESFDHSFFAIRAEPRIRTVAATLAREMQASKRVPAGGLRIQVSFSYSDGCGREIQKKIQTEPGPVPQRDVKSEHIVGADGQPVMKPNDMSPRWIVSETLLG